MEIKMPKNVEDILNELQINGYEAYIVGGCVRDYLLNQNPKDWDITTSARPEQVKELFKRTVDTGIEHGTVTVLMGEGTYEVTTYRIDGEYVDNRHPESVDFTTNLKEDLKRRDFTINAMAYNRQNGLIDLFNGRLDLERGMIRCVGDPNERFNEDALRMLRAIRFSAQLDFEIDRETDEAIRMNKNLIQNISIERIRDEITKIILSNNSHHFMKLYDTGLLEYILPEFIPNIGCSQRTPWHINNVDEHIIRTVENIEARRDLRWTMLLHDIAKAKCKTTDKTNHDHFVGHAHEGAVMAVDILKRFKFDNKTLKKIVQLIEYHDTPIPLDEAELRKFIATLGEELFLDLLKVVDADDLSKARLVWLESQEKTRALRNMYRIFKEKNYCLKKEDMKITGEDLINLGFEEGKDLGIALDELFNEVLLNPELNDNFELGRFAETKLRNRKNEYL